ncbi:hypothetical protein DYB35_014137 [Aphanomyces astaci]|uniref:PiggyBac transposable element-derived protein domain-containing protein n=1 Tax=Aphanomyces astaci TaxID=112090 RepID=A0A3R7B8M0_APHAT|nr:hypothetical protein DYB35_014137 [Aphanomyces astaci]
MRLSKAVQPVLAISPASSIPSEDSAVDFEEPPWDASSSSDNEYNATAPQQPTSWKNVLAGAKRLIASAESSHHADILAAIPAGVVAPHPTCRDVNFDPAVDCALDSDEDEVYDEDDEAEFPLFDPLGSEGLGATEDDLVEVAEVLYEEPFDAAQVRSLDVLHYLGAPPELSMNDAQLREMTKDGWNILADGAPPFHVEVDEAKQFSGYRGPSHEAALLWDDPYGLFLFFLPKRMWEDIAIQSNRYREDNMQQIVENMAKRRQAQRTERPGRRLKSLEELAASVMTIPPIKPHEILVWMGLLLGNMLCKKKDIRDQWKRETVGAVPPGTFGQFMVRKR